MVAPTPSLRRMVERVVPRWIRRLALVVVVLLTLGGAVLASFTLEPMRAGIWQGRGHLCGTIEAQDRPGFPPDTDLATVRQAEACFIRGYTRCQAVTLVYETYGIDFSATETLVVEPAFGSLAGCALAVVSLGHLASGGRPSMSTHRCGRVVPLADGLHILGCDVVIRAPTDTPPPGIPEATAVLGGSVSAFDKRLGPNNCCYANGWTYQGPYGPLWTGLYTGYSATGFSSANVDESSLARVIGIDNGGDGSGLEINWTMTQAKAICDSFLPQDAQYQTTAHVFAGSLVGIELRYTSASLAHTLPPSDFINASYKPAPPGKFYVFYRYNPSDPTNMTVRQCRVGTDESWTSMGMTVLSE